MTIKINIFSNFDQVANLFEKHQENVLVPAFRNGLNKSIIFARKTALKRMRNSLNIRRKDLVTMTGIKKAKGSSIDIMRATLEVSNKPMPLLWFVKGSKEPEDQKGKGVKRRRRIKVQIRKGKTTILTGGAFIQKKKTVQLFRRKDSGRFRKQSSQRLLNFFSEPRTFFPTRERTLAFFVKTFQRDLSFREDKEWAKIRQIR